MTLHPISGKSYLLPLLVLCASLCAAQTAVPVVLAPVPQLQFFDQSGRPLAFGCVFTYQSQTTTPLATYSDFTGQFQNQNPVLLNAGASANIWLQSGQAYTLTVKSSGGDRCALGQTLYTVDGVGGGASQLNTVVTPSGGSAAFTVQSQNQLFSITLTGNVAGSPVSFIGVIAPALVTFQITEDGAGAHTFTWPSNVIGAAPIDTVANHVTSQMFIWNGTTIMPVGSAFNSAGNTLLPGNVIASSINNIVSVDGNKYACSDVGIVAAQASLPSGKGIIDARGCQGVMTWASGITVAAGQSLFLGIVTITTSGQLLVNGSGAHVYGMRGGSGITQIVQSGTFPSSTPIAKIGSVGALSAATIEGVQLDCNNVANSIGGENLEGQELSGFFNVVVSRCTSKGIWYEGNGVQNSSGKGLYILSSGTSASYIGLYVHNASNAFRGISDVTLAADDATSVVGAGMTVDNSSGDYSGLHFETSTVGLDILNGLGAKFSNLSGNGTVPTLVQIENNASSRARLENVIANGSATTINDLLKGRTRTDSVVPLYFLYGSTSAPEFDGSPAIFDGGIAIGKGVSADGGGFKHKRFGATCTTTATAGNSCTTTFSWTTAFADANYTPVCTPTGPANGPAFAIDSFNASGVTVRVYTFVALASGYNGVDCYGVHD